MQIAHRLDQLPGVRLAEGEGIIGPERDAGCTEEMDEKTQRIGVMNERIDVEMGGFSAAREIMARIGFVIDGAQIGTNVKAVFDAADREWKRAAAMGEGD